MVKGSPSEVYYVIAILSAWTLFSIFLPYIVGWKRDKFVG
jgi:hypothetical protein